MKKKFLLGLPVILALSLLAVFLPIRESSQEVGIDASGNLAVEARVALAASTPGSTMGDGGPVPQQIIEPTFRRGGPPVRGISFADGLGIDCSQGLTDIFIPESQIMNYKLVHSPEETEEFIENQVQMHFEIWVPLKDLPKDDRVLEDPPVLLDNERIVEKYGSPPKDYLVVTIAYTDIHIYSWEPDFHMTIKINGLDAGPIPPEEEWWL